jgi:hypothetical protein
MKCPQVPKQNHEVPKITCQKTSYCDPQVMRNELSGNERSCSQVCAGRIVDPLSDHAEALAMM